MRKYYLLKTVLILAFVNSFIYSTYATWYGSHTFSYNAIGINECDDDGDVTGGKGDLVQDKDHRASPVGPSTSSGTMTCEYWDGANPVITLSDTDSSFKLRFRVTLSVSDGGGSGLVAARYNWNSAPDCDGETGTNFSNGDNIPVGPPGGINTLYLCAKDGAGNITTVTQVYNVNNPFPIITLSDTGSSFRPQFDLTLHVSGLGLEIARYNWNSAPDCNGVTGVNFSDGAIIAAGPPWGTNTLYLCARDDVGNVTTLSQVYNINNVPPTITLSDTGTNWRPQFNVTLSASGYSLQVAKYAWNYSPDCTGVLGVPFMSGDNIVAGPPWGTNTLNLCVRDKVGNITTHAQVYNIEHDVSAPTITTSPSTVSGSESIINVAITCTDGPSTYCKKIRYAWGSLSAYSEPTTPWITNTGSLSSYVLNTTLNTEGTWFLHIQAEDSSVPINTYTGVSGPYKFSPVYMASESMYFVPIKNDNGSVQLNFMQFREKVGNLAKQRFSSK